MQETIEKSVVPAESFYRILSKLNRFEIYFKKEMFFEIFGSGAIPAFEKFKSAGCRAVAFYSKLNINERQKFITYLQRF